MKEQCNSEDEIFKKLIKEGGIEKPSPNFRNEIMNKLEGRKTKIPEFKPLIPAYVWPIIIGAFLLSGLGLFLVNTEFEIKWSIDLSLMESIGAPKINLSRTMQYAIALVALFFLEIPFLKRFLDRENGL